jgi:hypothetical protein
MSNESGTVWKKDVLPQSNYYTDICVERVKKIMKDPDRTAEVATEI